MTEEQRSAIFYVFRGAGATMKDAWGGMQRVDEILAPKAEPVTLLRQALAALESCGAAAVEDGGAQWFDEKLVDAAHEAIRDFLASLVSAPQPKEK